VLTAIKARLLQFTQFTTTIAVLSEVLMEVFAHLEAHPPRHVPVSMLPPRSFLVSTTADLCNLSDQYTFFLYGLSIESIRDLLDPFTHALAQWRNVQPANGGNSYALNALELLTMFLLYMRSTHSQLFLSFLFHLSPASITRYINQARHALIRALATDARSRVSMPSVEEATEMARVSYTVSNGKVPSIYGVIDGSVFPIKNESSLLVGREMPLSHAQHAELRLKYARAGVAVAVRVENVAVAALRHAEEEAERVGVRGGEDVGDSDDRRVAHANLYFARDRLQEARAQTRAARTALHQLDPAFDVEEGVVELSAEEEMLGQTNPYFSGFHHVVGVNCVFVFDVLGRLRAFDIGWPGSTHDVKITKHLLHALREEPVMLLEHLPLPPDPAQADPLAAPHVMGKLRLLGDSGFLGTWGAKAIDALPKLVQRAVNPRRSTAPKVSLRQSVEWDLHSLKSWKRTVSGLSVSDGKAQETILAACLLHNWRHFTCGRIETLTTMLEKGGVDFEAAYGAIFRSISAAAGADARGARAGAR
jgi:hypothetical protein